MADGRINSLTNKLTTAQLATYFATLRLAIDDPAFTSDTPYILVSDLFLNHEQRIDQIEIDFPAFKASTNESIATIESRLDDINHERGELVYSAFVNWQNTTITKTEYVNKNFINNVEEVVFDRLGFYFVSPILNWVTKLEIQATSNPMTSSERNRNPHFFYDSQSYISMNLVDSSGSATDNGGVWIRIYKWV